MLAQLRTVADRLGVHLPVTLLVVPAMHGSQDAPADYLRWLHRQVRAGHELALHGFTHLDQGPPAGSPREHALRHWYTAGEGEFAALDRPTAEQHLADGQTWALRHGLAMDGFVAPAWLLSADSWDAVTAAGFRYTCTLNRLVALQQGRWLRAPSVVFSTRAAWRRVVSVVWTALVARRLRGQPLFRLELHPGDGDHALVQRRWASLLTRALADREALCLRDAVALTLTGEPRPGAAS